MWRPRRLLSAACGQRGAAWGRTAPLGTNQCTQRACVRSRSTNFDPNRSGRPLNLARWTPRRRWRRCLIAEGPLFLLDREEVEEVRQESRGRAPLPAGVVLCGTAAASRPNDGAHAPVNNYLGCWGWRRWLACGLRGRLRARGPDACVTETRAMMTTLDRRTCMHNTLAGL